MGGGNGATTSIQATWSIGEAAIIGTFSNSMMQFNAGVLQPNTDVVTSINTNGALVFGNQITISPNPSYADIRIHFNMKQSGKVTASLYNSASRLVKNFSIQTITAYQSQTYKISEFAAGSYFLKVEYDLLNGKKEKGIFKIIRL